MPDYWYGVITLKSKQILIWESIFSDEFSEKSQDVQLLTDILPIQINWVFQALVFQEVLLQEYYPGK